MGINPLFIDENGTPDGASIVFLHSIGTSGWMWQEIAALLGDYHCIIPDLPGHGRSNQVPWRSLSDTAGLILDLIQTNSPSGTAHIVALSLGSYVGLQLLSESQQSAGRAVFSGLNVLPLPNQRLMQAMGYVLTPLLKTDRAARMNAKALNIPEKHIEAYGEAVRQMDSTAFRQASRDAGNFRIPPNAAGIETPTLFVAGEHEHKLTLDSQKVLIRAMPRAEAAIAPGVGHGWSSEAPDLFAATVRAWIENESLPETVRPVDQAADTQKETS